MAKRKRKKQGGKPVYEVLFRSVLITSGILFFVITLESSRYVLSQGDYKPFYLEAAANVDTGMKVPELKKKYKGRVKEILPLFDNIKHERAIPQLSLEQAAILYASGKAIFIDVRGANEYEEAHIKGSLSMPLNKVKEVIDKNKGKFKNKILITYCHGVGCRLSHKGAYNLYKKDYKRIGVFFGGWNHWTGAGYPVTRKR